MKTEAVIQAFLALLEAKQYEDMPEFVVATSEGDLEVLGVYVSDGKITIDVNLTPRYTPSVGLLLLTYDSKKAVPYKDIPREGTLRV